VISSPGFAYVQARLQARHAAHPDDAQWRALAATRGLPAYLAEARRTGLAPWIDTIAEGSGPHPIEGDLRRRLHDTIDEIAGWTPAPWRPAVAWCHWLPELPLLGHLLAEVPPPPWLGEHHHLRPYLHDTATARRAALLKAGAGALVEGWEGGTPLAAWLAGWRQRWPRVARAARRPLDELAAAVEVHVRDFPSYAISDAWGARRRFQDRLLRLFRRHPVEPVALFSYLALLALDLERLRGGLVERAVFAPVEVET
jgi:hypothetical protein